MSDAMRVLVVDDDEAIRDSLEEILEDEGYRPLLASSIPEAKAMACAGYDLALVDIKLKDENGIDLLRHLKAERPQAPVIMISGHGTIALTAEAFKLGAHEFMEKPLRLIQVRACIRNALESVRLKQKMAKQARAMAPEPVYASHVMKELFAHAKRLASIHEPVVIMGPSGSGKELIASALHYEGVRGDGPFIATNVASLPLNLAEDELFGHEKGAFTGAVGQRIGCLENADGGTLFLDEIADMDLQAQAKLLRALETKQFARLGGAKPVTVNVRIVCATHKNLETLVSDGRFRHDLWFRLCAFVLHVPPLSQRKDDILPLAETFLRATCGDMGIRRQFSDGARAALVAREYPGNVRELRHVVTRAAVFAPSELIDDAIIAQVAPCGIAAGGHAHECPGMDGYASLDFRSARLQFERDYLTAALEKQDGNITATAAAIGMAQSNLSRKLKVLGIR
jgi:two-component system, NtrC family, nitrogen regulation response regulator NtrX